MGRDGIGGGSSIEGVEQPTGWLGRVVAGQGVWWGGSWVMG